MAEPGWLPGLGLQCQCLERRDERNGGHDPDPKTIVVKGKIYRGEGATIYIFSYELFQRN